MVDRGLEFALAYYRVQLLNLSLPIGKDSTQLSSFHRYPFDDLIVATARFHDFPLLTANGKNLNYTDVQTFK